MIDCNINKELKVGTSIIFDIGNKRIDGTIKEKTLEGDNFSFLIETSDGDFCRIRHTYLDLVYVFDNPIKGNKKTKSKYDNIKVKDIKTILPKLVESLEGCMGWMESMRESGDSGNWDWSEGDDYTKSETVLKDLEKLLNK